MTTITQLFHIPFTIYDQKLRTREVCFILNRTRKEDHTTHIFLFSYYYFVFLPLIWNQVTIFFYSRNSFESLESPMLYLMSWQNIPTVGLYIIFNTVRFLKWMPPSGSSLYHPSKKLARQPIQIRLRERTWVYKLASS